MNTDAQIVGGLAAGAIVGVVPWILGKSRGRATLARVAFWVCVGAGFVGGAVLALPTGVVFTILLALRPKPATSAAATSEPSVQEAPAVPPSPPILPTTDVRPRAPEQITVPPPSATTSGNIGWIPTIVILVVVNVLGYGDAIMGSRFITGAVVGVVASLVVSMLFSKRALAGSPVAPTGKTQDEQADPAKTASSGALLSGKS